MQEWTGLEPAELQPWWLFEEDNDNQEEATIHTECWGRNHRLESTGLVEVQGPTAKLSWGINPALPG